MKATIVASELGSVAVLKTLKGCLVGGIPAGDTMATTVDSTAGAEMDTMWMVLKATASAISLDVDLISKTEYSSRRMERS